MRRERPVLGAVQAAPQGGQYLFHVPPQPGSHVEPKAGENAALEQSAPVGAIS